jgi:hypothetical protein
MMARKPRPVPIQDVRRLSIQEILELWVQEIDIHPLTLERELRRFLENVHLDWRAGERIDPDTPDADLPGAATLVDREWLAMFCAKKGWPLPSFWFPPDPADARPRGRPSHMDAILQELERRGEVGELEATVTDQARALNDWAVRQGKPPLRVPSIRNQISKIYRRLKEGH